MNLIAATRAEGGLVFGFNCDELGTVQPHLVRLNSYFGPQTPYIHEKLIFE